MKVTLLLEGTYPYIQGGVSSWTHTLIRTLSDCEFSILYIGATRNPNAKYRYTLPDNVVSVQEVYLHEQEETPGRLRGWRKKEREEMVRFFKTGELPSRETLLTVRSWRKTPTAEAILEEEWAWNVSLDVYRSLPIPPALVDFVWNWRAMWLPLLRLMRAPIPPGQLMHSASTGYAGWYGAIMNRLEGTSLVVTEHGIYTREREEEIVRAEWVSLPLKSWWNDFFAAVGRAAYDQATFITTLSVVNRRAQVKYGARDEKIRLIPNGVNPVTFAGVRPTAGRPFTVGAILRVVPIKDVKTLLRAMAVVLRQEPDAKLMLIGPQDEDPEYYEECLALIDSLGIAEAIIWTGPVNILEYLPKLDCIVLTSISEGQPLVMLEAMAAGLPIVATDVGACRELIEGFPGDELGSCGLVTKLMTPDDTGAALLVLANSQPLRAEMGEIGRERVRRHYELFTVMRTYRNLYEEAVMS
ncbi:GT4 family glycosyltransferase PelF [Tumebacillus sp. DT12]|uniref:GT4 family glycosyltransferase PelF n=1 Tax=Tumebacillus lacus TaxID=2995335 RepID=A0ABT3X015_9BACL|nr:GT4 family glycosyltransferase PelF [Tumebacillus lacus]MCX7568885.1 GT4 family glycosyltransferase PelF [Tumebacillus lacus]